MRLPKTTARDELDYLFQKLLVLFNKGQISKRVMLHLFQRYAKWTNVILYGNNPIEVDSKTFAQYCYFHGMPVRGTPAWKQYELWHEAQLLITSSRPIEAYYNTETENIPEGQDDDNAND